MNVTTPSKLTLLAQADLLLLVKRFFMPPTAEILRDFLIEDSDLQTLLQHAGISDPQLIMNFRQTVQQLQTLSMDDWIAEYNRLFEGPTACPMNESGFVRRDKGAILGDIAGFYRAFGFQLSESASEKADHLVCQLEFTTLLLIMLAEAPNEEHAAITYNALSAFSFDHLNEWLPAFCAHLTATTTFPFYQQVAEILATTWSQIAVLDHLPIPTELPDDRNEESGTPYECDMAIREQTASQHSPIRFNPNQVEELE